MSNEKKIWCAICVDFCHIIRCLPAPKRVGLSLPPEFDAGAKAFDESTRALGKKSVKAVDAYACVYASPDMFVVVVFVVVVVVFVVVCCFHRRLEFD